MNVTTVQPLAGGWKTVAAECAKGLVDLISYIAFRILAIFSPKFAPQVEVVFVRLQNLATRIRASWRQEALQKEQERLRAENQALTARIQQLSLEKEQCYAEKQNAESARDQLRAEKEELAITCTDLSQRNALLSQEHDQSQNTEEMHSKEVQLLRHELETVAASRTGLLEEQTRIFAERDAARAEKEAAEQAKLQALQERNALQRELEQARENPERRALTEQLQKITAAYDALKASPQRERDHLDVIIEQTLPQLQKKKERVIKDLESLLPQLENRVVKAKLETALKILTFENESSSVTVAKTFAFHTQVQSLFTPSDSQQLAHHKYLTYIQ